MGVHDLGFHRRDAEERRFETVDSVDEAPETDFGRQGVRRSVFPDARIRDAVDAAASAFEQTSEGRQILGLWEPAGHANDRDRAVGERYRRAALYGRDHVAQVQRLGQVGGQVRDVGVVERDRAPDRDGAFQLLVEAIAELDGGQRVHAKIEEAHVGRRRFGQLEDGGYLVLKDGLQKFGSLAGAGGDQTRHDSAGLGSVLKRQLAVVREYLFEERKRAEAGSHCRPVHVGYDGGGGGGAQPPLQRLQCPRGGDMGDGRRGAGLCGQGGGRGRSFEVRHADSRPRAPGDGLRG